MVVNLPMAILAGGLGRRIDPFTRSTPKAIIEVAGKPFVFHQIELLQRHGFGRIVLCVGHLGGLIEETVGDGTRWGLDVRYSYDGPELLGTGGALRRALPLLGEAFFVTYADGYLDCDYGGIETAFLESGSQGLMTIFRNKDRWDKSNVLYQSGRIVSYDKRNPDPACEHIDYGVGVLRAKSISRYEADTPIDLEAIYKDLVAQDELAAYEVPTRFYEIGSPEGLEATRQYLARKTAEDGLYSKSS